MKSLNHARRGLILTALDWTRPKDPPMSLGQASILANLQAHEIAAVPLSYSVNHENFSAKKVVAEILQHSNPNTDIALGAFVWNEQATQEILTTLKNEKFPGRIILGGPQVSYVKRGLERYYPQADIFIRGYGEIPLQQLLQSAEEFPEIAGVHYAGKEDKGLSAEAELKDLPSPYLAGIIQPQKFIRFETQRGCPFRCSFCQHRESDVSQKRRNFPQDRIAQEIAWITQHREIQDVAVLDPTFNSGPDYLQVMNHFIAGNFSGKLSLQTRLEMVKDEFLNSISKLNETGRVVLEGGIQTIHKNEFQLIDRPNNVRRIKEVMKKASERNIEVEVSLIFGLPEQTVKSFQESIDFCKEIGASKISAFPLMLLRGTPLHTRKNQYGLVESNDIPTLQIDRLQDDIPHVIASKSFTFEDWKEMAKMAEELTHFSIKEHPENSLKAQTASSLETKTLNTEIHQH